MVRKWLCDGNDLNTDNGDDDVKKSFYKILKWIMYIEVAKIQERFEKPVCYKLMQEVTFRSTCISKICRCHWFSYI